MPDKKQGQQGRQGQQGQQGKAPARKQPPATPRTQTREPQKGSPVEEKDRIGGHIPKTQEEIQREKAATGRTAQGGPEGAEGVDWRDEGLIEEPGAPESQEKVQKESTQKK